VEFDWIRKTMLSALGVKRPPLYVPEWPALLASSIIEKISLVVDRPPFVSRKNMESTLADRVFSIEKAKRDLGYSPRVDPEEGIRQTVQWYREQQWI
jgi:nucleoside-diphosphate-sugar epimerase